MYHNLVIFILLLLFFSGCVSPKVVEEITSQRQEIHDENQLIKKENIALTTENTELKETVNRLSNEVSALVDDSLKKYKSYIALQDQYNALNQSYDLLSAKNSKIMANKADEAKRLLEELQQTRQELLDKEDELSTIEESLSVKQKELLATQQTLEEREQKVVELQSVINRKDSVLNALKERLSNALLGFEGDGLTITQKNGKVYISLEEKLLFASGSWQVDSRGVDALSKLSNALASQQEINVNIEGHTDSIPFGGRGQIKDNWDLSVVRATAIVKILTSSSSISPTRLSASGRGEYFPIASNKTAEGRRTNRRIEIILSPRLDDLYELLNN